jgi:SAM-dependent methyltransferase
MRVKNIPLIRRTLYKFGLVKNFTPKIGKVRFGDLYRTDPFSRRYGLDRGGAVDRVYIEQFLQENRSLVKGRVLEVANNNYTVRFGGTNVTQSDILHVNENNTKATIIADLGKPLQIEENLFDCIILTQTLQFIYNYEKAVENCFRLLKPGGYLLLTVPGITPIGKDPFDWYWSFTSFSMKKILCGHFANEDVQIRTYGNVLSASAFLYGLGKNEIDEKELGVNDPSFQVIVAVSARK